MAMPARNPALDRAHAERVVAAVLCRAQHDILRAKAPQRGLHAAGRQVGCVGPEHHDRCMAVSRGVRERAGHPVGEVARCLREGGDAGAIAFPGPGDRRGRIVAEQQRRFAHGGGQRNCVVQKGLGKALLRTRR